jgi:hypothetical protein
MLEEGEIVDRSTELLLGKKMKRYLLLGRASGETGGRKRLSLFSDAPFYLCLY